MVHWRCHRAVLKCDRWVPAMAAQGQKKAHKPSQPLKTESKDGFVITLRSGSAEISTRQGGQPQQQEVCKNYLAGRCGNGDRCRRLHEPAGVPQSSAKSTQAEGIQVVCVSPTVTISRERNGSKEEAREVCKNFLAGRCRDGDKCRRLHQPAAASQNTMAEKGRPEPQKQRDQKSKNKGEANKARTQPEQQALQKGRTEPQKQKDQKSKGDTNKNKTQPEQQAPGKGRPEPQKQRDQKSKSKNKGEAKKAEDRPEQQKQRKQASKQAEPKQPKKKQEAQQQPDPGSVEDPERALRLKALAAEAFERMEALKRQKSNGKVQTPSQPSRTQSAQLVPSESPPDIAPSPPRSSSDPEHRPPPSPPKVTSPTTNTPSGFSGKEELQKALASMEAWEVAELVANALTRAAGGPLPSVAGRSSTAARMETPQMDAAEYRRVISVMMVEDARVICAAEGVDAPEDAPVEELRQLLLDHFGCGGDESRTEVADQGEEVKAEIGDGEAIRVGDAEEEDAAPSAEAAARRRKLLMMEPTDGEFMLDPATQRVSSAEQA
eukprot:COSAG03_NODE_1191_length_4611_cov_1.818706_3_plen_548_part_00